MSSNRKKAESIASSMMILVDFDGAMVTDVVLQCNRAARGLSLVSVRLSVLEIWCSVLGAPNPYDRSTMAVNKIMNG